MAQRIYPAADLSSKSPRPARKPPHGQHEVCSQWRLDHRYPGRFANVEIREEVGSSNFFLFGLTADEVQALKTRGYRPWDYFGKNRGLRDVIEQIHSGYFLSGRPDLFKPVVDSLLVHDEFLVLADYQAYVDCQEKAGQAYLDSERLDEDVNPQRCAYRFTFVRRAIREYCQEIWRVEPVRSI